MGLIESLDALVSDLSDRGSPLRSYLQPGLSRHEIQREAEQRDAVLHPDVVTLFGWHDGFDVARWNDDEVNLELLPGFEFRPLNDALDQFELSRSIGGDLSQKWGGLDQDDVWAATWCPIVALDGRSIYISAGAADYGSVWFDPLQGEKVRLFASLNDAVDDVRSKLQAGTLTVTGGGLITGNWIAAAGLG
jgi:hypothetical protein